MLSRQRPGKPSSPPLMRRRFSRRSVVEEQQQSPPAPTNVLKDRSTNLGKEPTTSGGKRQKANDKLPMEKDSLRAVVDNRNDLDLPDFLLDEDNPFLECHESYSPEAIMERKRLEDERLQEEAEAKFLMESSSTTVSSLASGSFKQPPIPVPPPNADAGAQLTPRTASEHESTRFVPPKYICIRVQSQSRVPDWLKETKPVSTHPEFGAKVVSMDETDCQPQPPALRYTRQAPPQWSPPLPPSYHSPYPFSSTSIPSASPKDKPRTLQQQQQQFFAVTPVSTGAPLSPAPSRQSQAHFQSPHSRATSTMAVALVSPCTNTDRLLDNSYTSRHSQQRRTTMIPPPPLLLMNSSSSNHHHSTIHGPNRKHKREASLVSSAGEPVRRTSPVVQELRSLWSKVRNNNNSSAADISIPDLTMTESTVSIPPHGCLT